jgi:hypothetical protein
MGKWEQLSDAERNTALWVLNEYCADHTNDPATSAARLNAAGTALAKLEEGLDIALRVPETRSAVITLRPCTRG